MRSAHTLTPVVCAYAMTPTAPIAPATATPFSAVDVVVAAMAVAAPFDALICATAAGENVRGVTVNSAPSLMTSVEVASFGASPEPMKLPDES